MIEGVWSQGAKVPNEIFTKIEDYTILFVAERSSEIRKNLNIFHLLFEIKKIEFI